MIRNIHRIPSKLLIQSQCSTSTTTSLLSCNLLSTSSTINSSGSTGSTASFFKTSETNPANLSKSHLGRFYSIDNDVYRKLYAQHHGFPVELRENFRTFNEQCILVRKPYLDLKNCIDAMDLRKPVVRFIIYGTLGSGKTITLASMVHYGYVREFILVHIPWIPLWSRMCKEVVPSAKTPDFYDHSLNAVSWLTHFKTQNTELIGKLNLVTTQDYEWSKREVTPQGSPLLDIVDHGMSRPAHASECMAALFKELKSQSSDQKCKTMVLMDGVNELYSECKSLKRTDRKMIPYSNLTAFEAMKDLFKPDWTGGVVIVTVDKIALEPRRRTNHHQPRELLKAEGWKLFDPFVPIEIPSYTSQEVQTTIDYYLERKWLTHPAASSEESRLELEYLSAKNPLTLMQLCNSR